MAENKNGLLARLLMETQPPPATANLNMLAQGLRSRTAQQYPYMKNALSNLGIAYTPDSSDKRMLEYWPAGETGGGEYNRPANLPVNQPGVQVLSNLTRPQDLLADYVSHDAVNTDPKLKAMYDQFQATVPDETMRNRYEYHKANFGETRPFDAWKTQSGMPEYFRGYTFNQWPNAERMYTPQQLGILNQIQQYVGVKK